MNHRRHRFAIGLGACLVVGAVMLYRHHLGGINVAQDPSTPRAITPRVQQAPAAAGPHDNRTAFHFQSETPGTFDARHALFGMLVSINAEAAVVRHRGHQVSLQVSSLRRGRTARSLDGDVPTLETCADATTANEGGQCNPRLLRTLRDLHGVRLTELWKSDSSGFEQSFVLRERPSGTGPFRIEMGVVGAAVSVDENAAKLTLADGVALGYDHVRTTDAHGRELETKVIATASGIALEVSDVGATYPVTIDPLLSPLALPAITVADPNNEMLTVAAMGTYDVLLAEDTGVGVFEPSFLAAFTGGSRSYYANGPTILQDRVLAEGRVVAYAGDVNGDGRHDYVVGDPTFNSNTGRFRLYIDRTTTAQTYVHGTLGEGLGAAFAYGDVNHDGYSDLFVAITPGSGTGRVLGFWGSASGIGSTPNWQVAGPVAGGAFGSALAVGDFDGDGDMSLVVGAPSETGFAGAIYHYDYNAGALATTATRLGGPAGSQFGTALARAGDVDASGKTALVVGMPSLTAPLTGQGGARVYQWNAGSFSTIIFDQVGASANAAMGGSVTGGADFNGDNVADFAVGSPGNAGSGLTGRVDIYAGIGAATMASNFATATINGTVANSAFGKSIAFDDANGDGVSDLAIVWGRAGTNAGLSVLRGQKVEIAEVEGSAQSTVWWRGGDAQSDMASAGDVNGDGYADIVLGSSAFSNGQTSEGQAMVYYGNRGGATPIGWPGYPGSPGAMANWRVENNVAGQELGYAVGTAGDVNGDGFDDVLIGAPGFANGQTGEGAVFVYFGAGGGLPGSPSQTLEGNAASIRFGASIEALGDVNSDGYSDIAVGAPNANSLRGQVTVHLGSASGVTAAPAITYGGLAAGDHFGAAIANIGDLTGDGRPDLAISAPDGELCGSVFVYVSNATGFGATFASRIYGASNQNIPTCAPGFGSALAGGDFNGDRVSDLAIGIPNYDAPTSANAGRYEGAVQIHYGWGIASTPVSTYDLFLSGDFGAGQCSRCGGTLAAVDYTRDGIADLVVGSDSGSIPPSSLWWNGAFVYRGSNTGITTTPSMLRKVAHPVAGFTDVLVAAAGDVNGDGFADILSSGNVLNGSTLFRGAAVFMSGEPGYALGGARMQQPTAATNIALHGLSSSAGRASIRWFTPRNPVGRTRASLDVEYWQNTASSTVSWYRPSLFTTGYSDTSGAVLSTFSLPRAATSYALRARARYRNSDSQIRYGQWMYFQTPGHYALRTAACVGNRQNDAVGGVCNLCIANYYGANCDVFCTPGANCNSRGTCNTSGACQCNAGSAGASCQYTDAITCNANGVAQANGGCVCNAGFAGPNCQYSNAVTCSGHGVAQANGACICATGFTGARCDTCAAGHFGYPTCTLCTDSGTCNANGACTAQGSCTCNPGYTGASCNACAANYVGYPTCVFCNPATTCGGNGTCGTSGACNCNAGFAGAGCQYSNATTCNGHGTAQSNGSCVCGAVWTGASCAQCAAGYMGYPNCAYTDALNCNSHGRVQNDGSCICDAGYSGAACSETAATLCNSHGTLNPDSSCTCNAGYSGARCDACDAGFFGYPSCTLCTASGTCSSNGACDANGACICNAGYGGTNCQYSNATTCSSHGQVRTDGSCACTGEYGGARCDQCAADRFNYPTCTYCAVATTCNSHGSCNGDATCTCTAAFTGTNCDRCAPGFFGYPRCAPCDAAATCRGRGVCSADGSGCTCDAGFTGQFCQFSGATSCNGRGTVSASGTCTCDEGHTGLACESCAPNRYAYPGCRLCDAATTCRGNGVCNERGLCTCNAGFTGLSCEYSNAGTCSGHGVASETGTCTCDTGYGGTNCALTRASHCSDHGNPQPGGNCTCDAGYTGARCQYSAADTCNGVGSVNANGTCSCYGSRTGANCELCRAGTYNYPYCIACDERSCLAPGGTCQNNGSRTNACVCSGDYRGADCFISDMARCTGHGRVYQPAPGSFGYCQCDAGWGGSRCEYDQRNYCHGRGTLTQTIENRGTFLESSNWECVCDAGYASVNRDNCWSCAASYYDRTPRVNYPDGLPYGERRPITEREWTPTCVFCDAATTCSNAGRCEYDGTCRCTRGNAGPACQYSDANTCRGNGQAQPDGTCHCYGDPSRGFFSGANCQLCRDKYFGGDCKTYCDPQQTCGGGDCGATGQCTSCGEGFYLNNGRCVVCPAGHYCRAPERWDFVNGRRRYLNTGEAPELCDAGTYAPEGSRWCQPCSTPYRAFRDGSISSMSGRYARSYAPRPGMAACIPATETCRDEFVCTGDSVDPITGQCTYDRSIACRLCGNGVCDRAEGESCSICARDCGTCYVCNDQFCDSANGETCFNCANDCANCPTGPRPVAPALPPQASLPDPPNNYVCQGVPRRSASDPGPLDTGSLAQPTPRVWNIGLGMSVSASRSSAKWYDHLAPHSDGSGLLGLCRWENRQSAEAELCLEGAGPWSVCGTLSTEGSLQCSAVPRCSETTGYTCDRPADNNAMDCIDEGSFTGELSVRYEVRRDVGPFYASASAAIGAQSRGVFVSVSGPDREQNPCYPYRQNTVTSAVASTVTLSVEAGIDVGITTFSVSASARACYGRGQQQTFCTGGQTNASRNPATAAGLTIQLPSVDYGLGTWGGRRYTWEDGNYSCL